MDRWNGHIAVVTGASSGIGAAIAEAFARNGLKVAGLARRSEKVQELAEKIQECSGELHAVKCDLTVEEDIEKAFKWIQDNLGPVSILVNNAGVFKVSTLTGGPVDAWRTVYETNVMALCICTKLAIASMREAKIDGHVVHINSIAGHKVVDMPGAGVYAASKHGVTALTETLRLELRNMDTKIKVSSISPGLVWTEMFDAVNISEERRKIIKEFPGMESKDIADTVLYVVGTPPHVQIHEIIIKPIGEKY